MTRVRVVLNNKLVKRTWDEDTKTMTSIGKRVAKSCPLTQDERRIYVQQGAVATTVKIAARLHLKASDAFNILKQAVGKNGPGL